MIAYVLYNKSTPAERIATELSERIKLEQIDTQLLDADSPRGISMLAAYDVLGRPAVILMKDDGAPLRIWQGDEGLPQASEVAYLARQ